ncbi:MAG TPA: CoA ester lyase [Hyphomicrobiaceae bacterium]|jgi:citrate lyase subunit beta/citryl-CoA lyase
MRSLLFVPGDSDRKIAKALSSGADALILDLEDSVALDRKAEARAMTRDFIASTKGQGKRPRLYVRINALTTDLWSADLEGVMSAGPDGIILPKPRSGEDVHRLSLALDHAEERAGLKLGSTRIVAIATEVPICILNMSSFVESSSRLEGLTWGAEDLSAEVGSTATREPNGVLTSPYRLARDLCLFTAVSAGVQPIDTVFIDFRDLDGLKAEAAAAARDGFTGKLAIHPDQVEIINAAFTPSRREIEHARDIVAMFAASPGAGVISLNGQMYDRPHLTRAERVLARAGLAGSE